MAPLRTLAGAALVFGTAALAKTDLEGCTYIDGVFTPDHGPAWATRTWYVPDTGEICAFLDCGGGRAPPKTTVPGCFLYEGTETYSPLFLDLATITGDGSEAEATSTAAEAVETTTAVEEEEETTTPSSVATVTSSEPEETSVETETETETETEAESDTSSPAATTPATSHGDHTTAQSTDSTSTPGATNTPPCRRRRGRGPGQRGRGPRCCDPGFVPRRWYGHLVRHAVRLSITIHTHKHTGYTSCLKRLDKRLDWCFIY